MNYSNVISHIASKLVFEAKLKLSPKLSGASSPFFWYPNGRLLASIFLGGNPRNHCYSPETNIAELRSRNVKKAAELLALHNFVGISGREHKEVRKTRTTEQPEGRTTY